jgi:hypothetical protein
LGNSQKAGFSAISQVAISRVVTAAPCVFVPGILMSHLEKGFLKRNPRLSIPTNLAIITASLLAALPAAIAIFPQKASMSVDNLEPRFQNLMDKNQNKISRVYFNRGL